MKPFVWKEGMSAEETKNGAYWERNMLVLMYAALSNGIARKHHIGQVDEHGLPCGWYRHQPDPWPGWERVVSLEYGRFTFHVPDDFDLGNLLEIAPNWDGHKTAEKWVRAMSKVGIDVEPVIKDLMTGEFFGKQCPRCGASLLRNQLDDEWCSNVGGRSLSACTFGLKE
ncbi:hypothetical protein [Cohnella sp. GCM10012308]|uniref:hypothetical protein n=1 Tax=Cohnella sp. GCM10012308 TaxID=3317329 RepID=UPI0036725EE0